MGRNRPSISIVIPVYCAEQTITPLVEQLFQYLPGLADEYEVLLVNDGSKDNSWQIIEEIVKTYPKVTGINLMRNYGQHNALLCGIRAAKHEVVVTMDDDLQHPPETIHILLEKLKEGADVVYGSPDHRKSWTVSRCSFFNYEDGFIQCNECRYCPLCQCLPGFSD